MDMYVRQAHTTTRSDHRHSFEYFVDFIGLSCLLVSVAVSVDYWWLSKLASYCVCDCLAMVDGWWLSWWTTELHWSVIFMVYFIFFNHASFSWGKIWLTSMERIFLCSFEWMGIEMFDFVWFLIMFSIMVNDMWNS